MVSWILKMTWMWANSGYQLPRIFQRGRCETFKGVNFVVYWW